MPSKKSINMIDTSKGGYTKEEIEFRKEQEAAIHGDCNKFLIPPSIKGNKIAEKEFKRLRDELKERKVLSNIDNIQLALYCKCWADYLDCIALQNERGLFQEYTNKGGETNLIEAPWIKLRRALETQMCNISKQFGFTPVDRLKFTPLKKDDKKEDPLLKVLGGSYD